MKMTQDPRRGRKARVVGDYSFDEPVEITPVVRDHLQGLGWGTESYPLDSLLLDDDEQYILDRVSRGMTIKETAETDGINYGMAYLEYLTAVAKQEALNGFNSDVLLLSPLAQRIVVVHSLFGTGTDARVALRQADLTTLINRTRFLDKTIGGRWRKYPAIVNLSEATIRHRIERYDCLLGPKWRNSPRILNMATKVVEERTAKYNEWFGESWRASPNTVSNTPRTVISSARALKSIGITLENTAGVPYFGLVGTTVENKRKKASIIRKEILGHTQVYIGEGKASLAENVEARHGQTPAEKELEAREIEEFKMFVSNIGAMRLVYSMSKIRSWAMENGYSSLHRLPG